MVWTHRWSQCIIDSAEIWEMVTQTSRHVVQRSWRFHMWRVEQEAEVHKTKISLKLHPLATTTEFPAKLPRDSSSLLNPKQAPLQIRSKEGGNKVQPNEKKCVVCHIKHRVAYCTVFKSNPSTKWGKLHRKTKFASIAWKEVTKLRTVRVQRDALIISVAGHITPSYTKTIEQIHVLSAQITPKATLLNHLPLHKKILSLRSPTWDHSLFLQKVPRATSIKFVFSLERSISNLACSDP